MRGVLYLVSSVLVCFSSTVYSSTNTNSINQFTISDYIPEKFVDFEWKVNGSVNFSGDDRNSVFQEENSSLSQLYRDRDRTTDQNRHQIRLGTTLFYTYETIQNFLTTRISSGVGYNKSTFDNDNSEITTAVRFSEEKTSGSQRVADFNIAPSISAGSYLLDDFFVSANSNFSYAYSEVPTNRTESERTSAQYLRDYYTGYNVNTKTNNPSDSRAIQVGGEFVPGWGRVYEGVYASTALYMIEELRNNGLIRRTPDKNEMLELTELVYQNRLKHVIDSRIRRNEALTSIMTYLIDQGIVNDPGPYGHFLLQDVWDYFPRNNRRFGLKAQFGLGGYYSYMSNHESIISDGYSYSIRYHEDSLNNIDTVQSGPIQSHRYSAYRRTRKQIYLTGKTEYFIPINRQWQFDLSGAGKYYLDANDTRDTYSKDFYAPLNRREHLLEDDTNYKDYYSINLDATIGYLVNSRTSLQISSGYDYTERDYEIIRIHSSEPDKESKISTTFSSSTFHLSAHISYRISIPTSLIIKSNYSRNHSDSGRYETVDENSGDGYSLSVSLEHYLY